MSEGSVLIVDDEKNIRMTVAQALEPMGLDVYTAINGEEALQKVKDSEYDLILLDLRMPGVDGMEVLRALCHERPEIRIVIVTAYGTVERAVEAMKLGAADFIQKPFSPQEIRDIVGAVLRRMNLDPDKLGGYDEHIEWAKHCIQERRFSASEEHVRKALSFDASRAEAFNLLGALQELQGDEISARKSYRAAYALDPTYRPASANLDRLSSLAPSSGHIALDREHRF